MSLSWKQPQTVWAKKHVYENNKRKFAFHDSPGERSCFNSGTVSTQRHSFVYDFRNLLAETVAYVTIVHWLSSRSQFENDIFDLNIPHDILSFVQF